MKARTVSAKALPILDTTKVKDYISLAKPRLLMMVVFSASCGALLASTNTMNWLILLHVTVGTALVGAGANSMNQWIERHRDARMPRTRNRALPAGRISPEGAWVFSMCISVVGLLYLYSLVNTVTAVLGFLTWACYLFLYTPLKVRSWLNTYAGAISGAMPTLMGWAAMEGQLSLPAFTIFGVLYFWQMPHFFAIAWMYREDYARGGFQMLSRNDDNGSRTATQMILNTLLLLAVSVVPYFIGQCGVWYLSGALILGGLFLLSMVPFAKERSRAKARKAFLMSLTYLPILLTLMVIDKI